MPKREKKFQQNKLFLSFLNFVHFTMIFGCKLQGSSDSMIINRGYQCIDRCLDNIRVHAGAPGNISVGPLNAYISDRLGTGTLLKRMLLIGNQFVI